MFSASQGTTPTAANFIEDVFSTWLYTGNGTSQTITNGIDLTGNGGLVWMKGRSGATDHALYDTARGATFDLASNTAAAQTTQSTGLTGFLSNGFSIGSLAKVNTNAATYVSWTFREQPRFFDVVTYTGNGANRTIAHNLGSVPGCIIIKRLNSTSNWSVWHRSMDATSNESYMNLNTTAGLANSLSYWNGTAPTSTVFSLGTNGAVNTNGATYVAYLFAHDAGGFGATGADNVISCGSFTTDASANATVNLGYEPQWLLVKSTGTTASNWTIVDVMRGFSAPSANSQILWANAGDAESAAAFCNLSSTGFTAAGLLASTTYIYIAIRRGPMRTPTTGTSVFGLNARAGTGADATVTGGQTDDAVLIKNRGAVASLFSSRLTGTGYLVTSSTAAEVAAGTTILQANPWDVMDGVKVGTTSTITNASGNTFINYLFRRAPGFFDVVCYTGTGLANTQSHNLGVAPELVITKRRSASADWLALHTFTSSTFEFQYLNLTDARSVATYGIFLSSRPTATQLPVTGLDTKINDSGSTYVAYLFASCPGVSRVGTYTGTGATQVINCGFAAGARFVLIKQTNGSGDWFCWDSARGIVAGNDPYLIWNGPVAAEVTNTDWVDTAASGFELSNAVGSNVNGIGSNYIFLAIA